jgi:hypothetical protein
MSAHDFLLLVHLLLFVYWLGGDLGVFYSSGFVIDGTLGKETRLVAAKIMMNLDLVPRICMSLMLTVGGLLTEFKGLEHPLWQMVGIIALGPLWLAMVLTIHFQHGSALAQKLTRFDYIFRWVMIMAIIASVAYSFSTGRLAPAPWVGAKLLVFAFLIFCGLMIRMALTPFIDGMRAIGADAVTEASNDGMRASLGKVRPWVLAIWAGLIVEAYLGIAEPGGAQRLALLFGG